MERFDPEGRKNPEGERKPAGAAREASLGSRSGLESEKPRKPVASRVNVVEAIAERAVGEASEDAK